MPMVCRLPQSTVSEEMKDAFSDKRAMDAVEAMMRRHNPNTVAPNLIRPENGSPKEIYFHVGKHTPPCKWLVGYVQHLGPFVAHVSYIRLGSGSQRKVADEDIRIAPRNSLLKELIEQGLLFEPYGACAPEPIPSTARTATIASSHGVVKTTPRSTGRLLSE